MNVANMGKIAEIIEKCEPRDNIKQWNMQRFLPATYEHASERAGCVATWTVAVLNPKRFEEILRSWDICGIETAEYWLAREASGLLDLNKNAADFLFLAKWLPRHANLRGVSGSDVAIVMRSMVHASGELDDFIAINTNSDYRETNNDNIL